MGKIISSYIFPHPPIIVPEIGRGREGEAEATVAAAARAALDIKRDAPSTIILTTPHGPVFSDFVYVSSQKSLCGDFRSFGSPDTGLGYENNLELAGLIVEAAGRNGITAGGLEEDTARRYNVSTKLDHGALVPLYYVNKEYDKFKLVHIGVSALPLLELYRFGRCIGEAVERSGENVVFLASGDLSHRLSHDGPYGFNKKGTEFDKLIVKSIEELDASALLKVSEDFSEQAGECGLRSFVIMFGALDGFELASEVYSYEGPFGVGYSIARIGVGERDEKRELLDELEREEKKKMDGIRAGEDSHVNLARMSLETFVKRGRVLDIPEGLPDGMLSNEAGVFVSIKKHGQLRGCIGTTMPTRKNIAEEIIYNAISSGSRDPRFDPVEKEELDSLEYSVDVLKEPEPVKSVNELDVARYGVIVRAGGRSGLLLPNLEGVDTPEEQVGIALRKAGISPDERYEMQRFEVVRHK